MKYIASFSGGKDSTAMILKIIEVGLPLDIILFFDTGAEFKAVYNNIKRMEALTKLHGIEFVILKPEMDFLTRMLINPHSTRDGKTVYGYDWCGGICRWRTADKVQTINKFLSTLGDFRQYIGIAYDEKNRVKHENGKLYPLVDLQMSEKDCLNYCYECGWNWMEEGIELYSILDRVSCWCCKNKNLKELRNIYHFLPKTWELLKGLQSRIDRPFYADKTIFELEERFKNEDCQLTLSDFL